MTGDLLRLLKFVLGFSALHTSSRRRIVVVPSVAEAATRWLLYVRFDMRPTTSMIRSIELRSHSSSTSRDYITIPRCTVCPTLRHSEDAIYSSLSPFRNKYLVQRSVPTITPFELFEAGRWQHIGSPSLPSFRMDGFSLSNTIRTS